MHKTIDARGLMCPQPVIMAKAALKELVEGELAVLVDNTLAVGNLQALAESQGWEAHTEPRGADYAVFIHKGAESSSAPSGVCEGGGRAVVLISSRRLGSGNDEFSETLLKNFIFALTETTPQPATIIFVNEGAFFTCQGSLVLESLQQLSDAGVELLTCGACLDFYGLKDKLAIGRVTNMYVIAEKLLRAGQVIRL